MEKKIRVMAIGAHADECHAGCGAVLKLLADKGCECAMLHVAYRNRKNTPEERAAYDAIFDNAASMLGCRHITVGRGNPLYDGDNADRETLMAQLEAFQPDIVFLQWPQDSHPEHRHVAQCSYDAILRSQWNGKLNSVREIYAYEAGANQSMMYFYPDIYICFDSIAGTFFGAMEACFPGNAAKLAEPVEINSRYRGLCSGAGKYAQPLKVVKFPGSMGIDDSDLLLRRLLAAEFKWAGGSAWPWGNQYYQN